MGADSRDKVTIRGSAFFLYMGLNDLRIGRIHEEQFFFR